MGLGQKSTESSRTEKDWVVVLGKKLTMSQR